MELICVVMRVATLVDINGAWGLDIGFAWWWCLVFCAFIAILWPSTRGLCACVCGN